MKKVISLVVGSMLLSSCAYAWGWGHDRGYAHHDRYEYHDGHYWVGGAIFAGALVAGAIIASLPPRHDIVYIGGARYYWDGQYYYQDTPSGYVVVQPTPTVVIEQTSIVRELPRDFVPVRFRGVQYYVNGRQWYVETDKGLMAVVDPTR